MKWTSKDIYIYIIQRLVLDLFSGDSSATLSACYIVTPVGAINEWIIDSFTFKKHRFIWKLNKRQFYEWTTESFTCLIYLLIINMLVHSERKSDIYVNRWIIYWFIQNNESLRKKHHYLFVTQRCAAVLFWLFSLVEQKKVSGNTV